MKKMVLSAFFLALGLVLPFLTGQIPQIGSMLLPMHIPVLICGYVCGWKYGLIVGFITPLFRTMLFSMPPFVTALCMAFELATYGAIVGILYAKLAHNKYRIYLSLLSAMLAGRIVWGLMSMVVYGVQGTGFTFQMFIGGAIINAVPGIILQLVLIPTLIFTLEKTGVTKIDDLTPDVKSGL